jgi:hypothetical protein
MNNHPSRQALSWIAAGIVSICAVSSAHASITVYNSQASYLAAITNPGVDTYDSMAIASTPSPINRTAGAHTYSASASTTSFYPAGSPADVWLSLNTATDVMSIYNLSAGVRGVGGFFFGSDISGNFLSGQDIRVIATDGSGSSNILLNNTTTGTFLGFVTDGAFSGITVEAVQPGAGFTWPTVNDLTLGEAVAVPEPGQIASGLVLLVGAAGYVIRRRKAAK